MENHSCEENTSKQSMAFVSLKEVVENQKQKIIDVEDNNLLKADCKSELNKSLKIVMKMVKKEAMLDKECHTKLVFTSLVNLLLVPAELIEKDQPCEISFRWPLFPFSFYHFPSQTSPLFQCIISIPFSCSLSWSEKGLHSPPPFILFTLLS